MKINKQIDFRNFTVMKKYLKELLPPPQMDTVVLYASFSIANPPSLPTSISLSQLLSLPLPFFLYLSTYHSLGGWMTCMALWHLWIKGQSNYKKTPQPLYNQPISLSVFLKVKLLKEKVVGREIIIIFMIHTDLKIECLCTLLGK